jgi:hypothetical protein
MTELEKIEEQIRRLQAKKEALESGVPVSKTELRKIFLKALPAEDFFGLTYVQILGALDMLRARGTLAAEQCAELDRLGLAILKKYTQKPETEKPETAV